MSEWEMLLTSGVTAELLSSITSYRHSLERQHLGNPAYEIAHTGKFSVDTERRLGTATARSFKRVATSR
jgi:hypothetical protein